MPLIKIENSIPSNLLSDRFLAPPFSILDTKQGYWQHRKRDWQKLGIQSELGRGDNIPGDNLKNKYGKCLPQSIDDKYGRKVQATSIFDPVLCEIVYRWFSMDGAKVIDPFAGGSVRGIVASCLGKHYTGIDLSTTQVDANKLQFEELRNKYKDIKGSINWVNEDSMNICDVARDEYDLLFTCPPYADLEVYSDDPRDISNFNDYGEFQEKYFEIIKRSCSMLKEDSFAVCVVGEVRGKDGNYYNFVGDTVNAFKNAGLNYYNDIILVNVIGTLPVRAPKQFNSGRKIGKQHQNVLVFYKGNTKNIKNKFGVINLSDNGE